MWTQKLLHKEENNYQREEAAYRRGNIPCQERGLGSKIYKGLQNQTWNKQQQKWNQTIESIIVLDKWLSNSLKNYQWPTTLEKVFNILSHQRKAKRFHFSPLRRGSVKTRGERMLMRMWRKRNPFSPWKECRVVQVATVDISMVVPPKTENRTTAWSNTLHLAMYPKDSVNTPWR